MPAACNCKNEPCDCHEPVVPHSALALSAGTSTIVGARINKGTARELARFCASHDCTQSSVIREFVSQLTKSPLAVQLAKSDNSDADAQYAALLDVLGVDPAAATTQQIEDAIVAILEAHPPEGDGAGPDAADPLAAVPEAPPPAVAAAKQVAASATPRGAVAKLSKIEQDYCKKYRLSAAQFAAKKANAVRNNASAGTASVKASRADAPAAPQPFTAAELALFDREHVPPAERRAYLAARKQSAIRTTTK